MKNLNLFKKDLNNCSRCGLCNAVCPVYQLTKNDCTSPRGKFIMLYDLLKNKLKPSKKMKKYMTMCINCGTCTKYCPSKIDTTKINEAFRKDCPEFFFDFGSFGILIKYIFSLFVNNVTNNFDTENKKIIFITSDKQKNLPEKLKKADCIVREADEIPVEFAFSNFKLYKELSKQFVQDISESNNAYFVTDSILLKLQVQTGLKQLNITNNVILYK